MNGKDMIDFLVYIGVVIVGYACVREFVQNLLRISPKGKAVVSETEAKFSIIMIVYIICLYVQPLFGLLPLFVGSSHLIFYTWLDHVNYYFFTSISLFGLGIINLINVEFLYVGRKVREVKRIWITLKIGILPFYLLNGIHYLYAIKVPEEGDFLYVLLIAFLIVMVPIMLFSFPGVLNFLNGCIGWSYIRDLQVRGENKKRPSWIHYVFQSFPVLDLISMAVILKRYKVSLEIEEEKTAEMILPDESAAEPKKQMKRKMRDAVIFFAVILLFIVIYFWAQPKEVAIP